MRGLLRVSLMLLLRLSLRLLMLSSMVMTASLLPSRAQAGSPMLVDDANIATAGNCQLESWGRAAAHESEAWLLPACNPEGHVELALGLGRLHVDDEDVSQAVSLQAKTLWQPLDGHDWGAGLALGTLWQSDGGAPHDRRQLHESNVYAYFPLSVAYDDHRGALHLNLGLLSERSCTCEKITWGLGTSWQSQRRTSVLAEIYGEPGAGLSWQAGWRRELLPDRLELDATVSDGSDAPLRYALGLRWLDIF